MTPNFRQPLVAFLAVLTSFLIVMGAFSATITEDRINSFLTGKSLFPSEMIMVDPSTTGPSPNFPEESGTPEAISTNLAALETKMAEAPDCIVRKGWEIYIIREGDSLEQLAQSRGVTPPIIQVGNCLIGNSLAPGNIIYLPPVESKIIPSAIPSPTITPSTSAMKTSMPGVNTCPTQVTCRPACIPPSGWVSYFLVEGDTVPILSERFGVSIFAIQTANCLKPPLVISEGDLIYMPGPTSTPTPGKTLQLETPLPTVLQP